jgi:hypothetical protein
MLEKMGALALLACKYLNCLAISKKRGSETLFSVAVYGVDWQNEASD